MNDWRTITVEAPDGLRRDRWTFSSETSMASGAVPRLYLAWFAVEDRASKRHKWTQAGDGWRGYPNARGEWTRGGNKLHSRSKDPPPPLPASVRDEVLRRFRDAVTVVEPERLCTK